MHSYNNLLLLLHKRGVRAALCTTTLNSKGTQVTAMCMGYVVTANCEGYNNVNKYLIGVDAMCKHLDSLYPPVDGIPWGPIGNTKTHTQGLHILGARC